MDVSQATIEFQNVISEELCKEAIMRIYNATQQKRRRSNFISAMIGFVISSYTFLYYMSHRIFVGLLFSIAILSMSLLFLRLFFRGYSIPKSHFVKRIQKMSNPNERRYAFFEDRVEEYTDQSTRKVMFSQITMIIDAKNVLVLLADNTRIILSKKCIPGNYGDFLSFLQNTTNAKCVE